MKNRVAERRQELGMTQEELAAAARVGQATISAIEQGHRIPMVDTALMIAAALNRTVEELFCLD